MTLLAYSRPFWPLFLHVLGAMLFFGAILAAFLTAATGHSRATFQGLILAVPAWVLLFAAGTWLNSDANGVWKGTLWLDLGMNIATAGLVILLLCLGAAYWWVRSGKPRAGRVCTGLGAVNLVLLAVAWLAMSGKWG